MEKIIRIIEERRAHGILFQLVETQYEFGYHYVCFINGMPDYHSVDLEKVREYMYSF